MPLHDHPVFMRQCKPGCPAHAETGLLEENRALRARVIELEAELAELRRDRG